MSHYYMLPFLFSALGQGCTWSSIRRAGFEWSFTVTLSIPVIQHLSERVVKTEQRTCVIWSFDYDGLSSMFSTDSPLVDFLLQCISSKVSKPSEKTQTSRRTQEENRKGEREDRLNCLSVHVTSVQIRSNKSNWVFHITCANNSRHTALSTLNQLMPYGDCCRLCHADTAFRLIWNSKRCTSTKSAMYQRSRKSPTVGNIHWTLPSCQTHASHIYLWWFGFHSPSQDLQVPTPGPSAWSYFHMPNNSTACHWG